MPPSHHSLQGIAMASKFHCELHVPSSLLVLLLTTLLPCASTIQARSGPIAAPKQPQPVAGGNASDAYLSVHNQARAAVGVAALQWSPQLAGDAARLTDGQRNRSRCGFADLSSSQYGANQAWASYALSPGDAVRSWVGEGAYYNYTSGACAAGHQCGVYTQVVWRKTAEVGCAQAACGKDGPTLTICLYNPHGNVQGEKPY